jgi:putative endonuclease
MVHCFAKNRGGRDVMLVEHKYWRNSSTLGLSSNLKRRFVEHNSGSEFSTKPYKPFELIHYEAYKNEKDAKRRELYFKITKGKTTLKIMLREYFDNLKAKE